MTILLTDERGGLPDTRRSQTNPSMATSKLQWPTTVRSHRNIDRTTPLAELPASRRPMGRSEQPPDAIVHRYTLDLEARRMVAEHPSAETPPTRHADDDLRLLGRKVARAWRDGTLGAKSRHHARKLLYVPAATAVDARRLPRADRTLDLTTGFRDHRGSPLELRCSDAALHRLRAAFMAAEEDRAEHCPAELEVRGLWAEWLALHYQPLREALTGADVSTLRSLLQNLHRDSLSTGVGGTIDDVNRVPRPFAASYYRTVWCRYRDLLEEVRPQWEDVSSPVVGNPVGAWTHDRLVQIETLRHAHHATTMLRLLEGLEAPRIVEIGGGLGGQAYQCVILGSAHLGDYTIVDLPEVACLAGYCLMASLGEDRVRLFGEEEPTGSTPHIEVLPHWSITCCDTAGTDLVYNAHSFSEMDGRSATFYLAEVERICRGFFFHINHETRFRYRTPDGGFSLNRIGSEMAPAPGLFHLVDKRPQAFVRPENRRNQGYAYLYERCDDVPCPRSHGDTAQQWHRALEARQGPRVLLLSSSAGRYGSDRAMSELASALSSSGYTVAAAVPCKGPLVDAFRAMGLPCFVAPLSVIDRSLSIPRLSGLFAAAARSKKGLIQLLQGFAPDVVYSNTSHVVDGPALARAFRADHVWHLREIERVPPLLRRLYGYWLLATSSRVVTISEAVRQAYFERAHRSVVVVPDGVDLTSYPSVLAPRRPSEYSLERPLRVLSVGRITPWKGQDVAVQAVSSLAEAGRPVQLRVVGGALTERDRSFEQRLRDESRTCPAVSIEGEVDDVRGLYRWSDVVVHTAVQPEPFGRVIVEAMASGCAVVATDHGGPREIIRDDIDGRLIRPADPRLLATVLDEFLATPSEVARLASAARPRAERFSMEATARSVANLLADISKHEPFPGGP